MFGIMMRSSHRWKLAMVLGLALLAGLGIAVSNGVLG